MKNVQEVIHKFRVTPRYKGYNYLVEAIQIVSENNGTYLKLSRDIYPVIAQRHGTTVFCVERDIRTVIEKCWHHNRRLVQSIIEYETCCCPTNGEFIESLAYYLSKE